MTFQKRIHEGSCRIVTGLVVVLLLSGVMVLASEPPRRVSRSHAGNVPLLGLTFEPGPRAFPQPDRERADFGPDSRGQNFLDLPTPEISVGLLTGSLPSHDLAASVFGKTSGELVLLTHESYALKAAYSSNNGATFGGEKIVAGPDPPVIGFSATLAGDGKLYAAYLFGDSGGDVGIRFQRSDDTGRTWTAPVSLVKRGDATHGVSALYAIAANSSGRVAVIFDELWEGRHVYVMTSTDGGANWNGPVRVDATDDFNAGITGADVTVGSNGWVHAAFTQARGGMPQVWYARSKDGGVSFETERNLDFLLLGRPQPPLEPPAGSDLPDIEIANDGSVLLTLWDSWEADYVHLLRSSNGGDAFTLVVSAYMDASDTPAEPRIWVAPGTNTLLLGWVRWDGRLQVTRSADNGATWGLSRLLANAANTFAAVRTGGTKWAVAWEDRRNAGMRSTFTDIYVRVSTDDGSTFGAEQRADRDAAGASESRLAGLAACGADTFFASYLDRRPSPNSTNVWANRSAVSPFDLSSNERRVDADTWTDNALQYSDAAVTTDGADHVYVAYSSMPVGPWPDLYVAASADRGRTFSQAIRVSTSPPGTAEYTRPMLSAHPDGTVYAAYTRETATAFQLVVNRSRDFGRTWLATEKLIATPSTKDLALASVPGGKVYLAYEMGNNIHLARSSNYFDSFTDTDVDQNDTGYNERPKLCAQGDQVILVLHSPNVAITAWSVWGTVSADGGGTWSSSVQLRPEGIPGAADYLDLACDGTNAGVAVWSDNRSQGIKVYANRYDGSAWIGDVLVSDVPDAYVPRVAFYSGTTGVAVSYGDESSVWLSVSNDGGARWLITQRLDDAAPQPLAASAAPFTLSDRAGNIWVVWTDYSAGYPSVAVRWSGDGGESFGPVYRANREQPQGSRASVIDWFQFQPAAASPGVAHLAFAGERSSSALDTRINAYEANDMDRDGASAHTDCNDQDALSWGAPAEVAGLRVSRGTSAARLDWTSQAAAAGPGTAYDIVTGYVADLLASRSYGAASCLASVWPAPPYDDSRTGPPARDSFYYLARAKNGCGTATYGNSSLDPDPRDALDGNAPCP